MPVPEFVRELRSHVGHAPLWLPGVTAVVMKGDEVLLVQRSDNLEWTPVTGIVEPGEHPAHAAVREVEEEAGVRCRIVSLSAVSVTSPVVHENGDRAQYLDHAFLCEWITGEPFAADDESVAAGWFALDDLPAMKPELGQRVATAASRPPKTQLLL